MTADRCYTIAYVPYMKSTSHECERSRRQRRRISAIHLLLLGFQPAQPPGNAFSYEPRDVVVQNSAANHSVLDDDQKCSAKTH